MCSIGFFQLKLYSQKIFLPPCPQHNQKWKLSSALCIHHQPFIFHILVDSLIRNGPIWTKYLFYIYICLSIYKWFIDNFSPLLVVQIYALRFLYYLVVFASSRLFLPSSWGQQKHPCKVLFTVFAHHSEIT